MLIQRWDELLRLVPGDMGLTAALGQRASNASDPITWLGLAADVPRQTLDGIRRTRNDVASNRPVPDREITGALDIIDRVMGAVGRFRFPR